MSTIFNELYGLSSHAPDANLDAWWPGQDDAASTTVVDQTGNVTGTLIGGDDTADKSATGPNSWLSKALHLNGSDDAISLGNDKFESDAAGTFFTFIRFDSFSVVVPIFTARRSNGDLLHFYLDTNGKWTVQFYQVNVRNDAYQSSNAASIDTWYAVSWTSSGTAWTVRVNGVDQTLSALIGSNTGHWFGDLPVATHAYYLGRGSIGGASYLDGFLAGSTYFSRELSAAEKDELPNGPEPVTASEQELAGTAQQGETLTATPAGWGLPSPFNGGTNGDITNGFRWTRSDDDSGTNEADIEGATNSTYTQMEADVGKYLRCWISGTNDSGNDPAADTATPFTDVVAEAEVPAALAGRARLMKGVG